MSLPKRKNNIDFIKATDEEHRNIQSQILKELKEAVESKKIKKIDLAKKMGVHKSHISRMLSGKKNFSFWSLAKFGVLLGIKWKINKL